MTLQVWIIIMAVLLFCVAMVCRLLIINSTQQAELAHLGAENLRLELRLSKIHKLLRDTIRTYMVDDEEWDPEEKANAIMARMMEEEDEHR